MEMTDVADPKTKTHVLSKSLDHQNKVEVTSLGVILNSGLSFKSLKSMLRSSLMLVFRLDYSKALFTVLPKKSVEKLQLIQFSAARL